MKLECLGSSSSGNCYIFHPDKGKKLILECGVKYTEIQKAIGWNPSDVAGCIVSHEHRDHCKSFPDLLKVGVRCYGLPEVFKSFSLKTAFMCEELDSMKKSRIGDFVVFPLPVKHDVPCLGYVIDHPEMGKTLFLTDTMYCEYRVKGLSHVMIEANYSDEVLKRNIDLGIEPASMQKRLLKSHMELGTTIKILQETDLQNVNEIVLLHLSSRNSNEDYFRLHVQESTQIPVFIAQRGLKIQFNKDIY